MLTTMISVPIRTNNINDSSNNIKKLVTICDYR